MDASELAVNNTQVADEEAHPISVSIRLLKKTNIYLIAKKIRCCPGKPLTNTPSVGGLGYRSHDIASRAGTTGPIPTSIYPLRSRRRIIKS